MSDQSLFALGLGYRFQFDLITLRLIHQNIRTGACEREKRKKKITSDKSDCCCCLQRVLTISKQQKHFVIIISVLGLFIGGKNAYQIDACCVNSQQMQHFSGLYYSHQDFTFLKLIIYCLIRNIKTFLTRPNKLELESVKIRIIIVIVVIKRLLYGNIWVVKEQKAAM